MATFTINPADATIIVVVNPEEAREIIANSPYGQVALRLPVFLALLEQQMGAVEDQDDGRRCPGSGQPGVPNGALLHCGVCHRLVGVNPPLTLPEHERPVYDDGTEMRAF